MHRCMPLGLASLLVVMAGCQDDAEAELRSRTQSTSRNASDEPEAQPQQSGERPSAGERPPRPAGSSEADAEEAAADLPPDSPLLHPDEATDRAPPRYAVKLETTAGDITVDVHRAWAPKGADRFYNLVRIGFYDDARFFRHAEGFVVQFGLKGIPQVDEVWQSATIEDDPVEQSNERAMVTFAKRGAPHSRTTQVFINLSDNPRLDAMGFAPFGRVREDSLEVLDSLYDGYGERPDQGAIRRRGNAYLQERFPKLDAIERATLVEP